MCICKIWSGDFVIFTLVSFYNRFCYGIMFFHCKVMSANEALSESTHGQLMLTWSQNIEFSRDKSHDNEAHVHTLSLLVICLCNIFTWIYFSFLLSYLNTMVFFVNFMTMCSLLVRPWGCAKYCFWIGNCVFLCQKSRQTRPNWQQIVIGMSV